MRGLRTEENAAFSPMRSAPKSSFSMGHSGHFTHVIPAKAGIQLPHRQSWMPAFAGMTIVCFVYSKNR